jgi:AcrR family transcriptional regulator
LRVAVRIVASVRARRLRYGLASMAQPRRTQAERRSGTQRALIAHATVVFASRGYDSATLAEIAQRAQVSKGGVHHHFRAKGDLVAPVVDHCIAVMAAQLTAAAAVASAPVARWRAGVAAVLSSVREGTPESLALVEFMTRAQHDETLRIVVAPRIAAVEARIAAALEQTLDAAGLSLGAPAISVARTLVAWVAGLVLRRGLGDGDDAREPVALLPPVMGALLT